MEPTASPQPPRQTPTELTARPQITAVAIPNHKPLYMTILVMLIITGAGYGAYYWQHQKLAAANLKAANLQTQITNLQAQVIKLKSGEPAPSDPTTQWTAYASPLGKFSLRYPTTWVQPVSKDSCGSALDRTLYLGPDTQSVQKCATDDNGQILVDSVAGDKTTNYTLAGGYNNVVTTAVTVDGVSGKRSTATFSTNTKGIGYVNGTKIIQYVFYTNAITYRALYIQAPPGNTPSQDVSSDFDLMVTKTLKFSS